MNKSEERSEQVAKKDILMLRLAAVVAPGGGAGSHLIMHKLHEHPEVMALTEYAFRNQEALIGIVYDPPTMMTTSKADLKSIMRGKMFAKELPIQIENEQLSPPKRLKGGDVRLLVLNKPRLKNIINHRYLGSASIPPLAITYIFKNPVSFYYKKLARTRQDYEGMPGQTIPDEEIQERVMRWLRATLYASLYEFAQIYDPNIDYVVSFEHLVGDVEREMANIFSALRVSSASYDDEVREWGSVMTHCCHAHYTSGIHWNNGPFQWKTKHASPEKNVLKHLCGKPLYKKLVDVRDRNNRKEEVLHCPEHGQQLGPGEYNYIRTPNPSALESWRKNEDIDTISEILSDFFGPDLIAYYINKDYEKDKTKAVFSSLMNKFLQSLKK